MPLMIFSNSTFSKQLSATEMIEIAENHIRGDSFKGKLTMEVIRGKSKRTLEFKNWSQGRDRSLIKILSPKKDKGSMTLRVKDEMWQYLPKIDRRIKIPPSMMLQSWMGSDFSNDDLMKSSSLFRDYNHKLLDDSEVNGVKVHTVLCRPKNASKILWSKVIYQLDVKNNSPVKIEYYNDSDKLIKTYLGENHKKFGKRFIPTKVTMMPYKKKNKGPKKTILFYDEAEFDMKLPDSIFSISKM